jgi:hypothetical protein
MLRRSAALHSAAAFFVLIAVAAVCSTLFSRVSLAQTVIAGLAALAILTVAAARHIRHEPGSLKIGPDMLTIWDRAGILRAQGRITGCSQWSDCLLVLSIDEENGHSQQCLIAADAVDRNVFRELSVVARRAAHV